MLALVTAVLAGTHSARAEVVLLVQGYFGNGDYWRSTGVAAELASAGWSDGGHLRLDDDGVHAARAGRGGGRRFYTLALPSAASLGRQLPVLERYVDFVRAGHADESLFLVGHSAGGVLARLYMVEHPQVPVAALVTIASPHLGTEVAALARLLSEAVAESIAEFLQLPGLAESQRLYRELAPEQPGNFLYRLNRRAHPPSRYVSVVRLGPPGRMGDVLVPRTSQDMNAVLALHGRAIAVYHGDQHALQADDGRVLAQILERLHAT